MNETIRADQNGGIYINLDKPRELKLGHKALSKFCALTHVRVDDIVDAIEDWGKLTALYYCMLSVADPGVTTENIDDLLEHCPPRKLFLTAVDVITDAFGEEADEESEGESKDEFPTL